jgi:hypothetical protein
MSINDFIVVKESGVICPDNVPFVIFIMRPLRIGQNWFLKGTRKKKEKHGCTSGIKKTKNISAIGC